MKQRRFRGLKWLFYILPGFLGLWFFYIRPHRMVLGYAFSAEEGAGLFDQFTVLFSSRAFGLALSHTAFLAGTGCLIMIPAAMLTAHFLVRLKRWRGTVESILLLPMFIPSSVTALLYTLFFPTALQADLKLILAVFIWKYTGYLVLLFTESLYRVPADQVDAARSDGAGPLTVFFRIELPYVSPAVFFGALMTVMNSFRMFREVYLLFGDHPREGVYLISHYINNAMHNMDYGKMSAAALVTEIIILVTAVMFLAAEKKISEGTES